MVYAGVKVAAGAALGVVLLGAVYLYAVRGQALLLDLATMTRAWLCL
jgi:hypothetical protein